MHQTQAPQAPAPRRRLRSQGVDFLRHAGSIGERDLAAFAVSLHELLGRHGYADGAPDRRTSLPEDELWATVSAWLDWLETLHELAPRETEAAQLMQNRLEDNDEALRAELKRARDRARWCGGMPVWLVCTNAAVLMLCGAAAGLALLRGPTVVQAPPQDFATSAEVRALERRLETLQDDQAFVVERLAEKLQRLEAQPAK